MKEKTELHFWKKVENNENVGNIYTSWKLKKKF